MLFSQRKGLKPTTKVLQLDSIDQELRNRIWSLFTEHIFGHFEGRSNYSYGRSTEVRGSNLEALLKHYWFALFKQPTDTLPRDFDDTYNALRDYFFKCTWNEAYDFVEFTLK